MKKCIIFYWLFLLSFTLIGCSSKTTQPLETSEIQENTDSNLLDSEIIEENSMQKISKKCNLPILDEHIDTMRNDNGTVYTIDLQRDLIGKSFIHYSSGYSTDIVEKNKKIYLKENDYFSIVLLEISESQFNEIKSKTNIDNIIYSFSIENVYPIDNYYYAECDIDKSAEHNVDPYDIHEYVTPYTEIAVNKNVIVGKCNEIHEITTYPNN